MSRIDTVDLLGSVLGAMGGAGLAFIVLGIGDTNPPLVGLAWLAMPLFSTGVLMPIVRRRPWALSLSSAPAALALFLTFGIVSITGHGTAADRAAYIWGSFAAAVAFAAFALYAHRDGMRRHDQTRRRPQDQPR